MSSPLDLDVNRDPGQSADQGAELEPIYFGSERALFGCLHAPRGPLQQGCGVVICPAAGPEYIRCHRSMRVLAAMLAKAGYPVLRFDYFATGDSLGEGEEATLARWQADIADAVRFMRGRYRVTRMTLLGVRIGAALAVKHLIERGGIERLVLWDPVVNGQTFVDDLRMRTTEHEQWLAERHGSRPTSVPADGPRDLFGFRYSDSMIGELTAFDLLSLCTGGKASSFILDNCEDANTVVLAEKLRELGLEVELRQFQAAKVWMAEPYQGLLSAQSLKIINNWISGGEDEQL